MPINLLTIIPVSRHCRCCRCRPRRCRPRPCCCHPRPRRPREINIVYRILMLWLFLGWNVQTTLWALLAWWWWLLALTNEIKFRSKSQNWVIGDWWLLFTMKIVFIDWSIEGIIMESSEIKCFDCLYRLEHRENHHGSDLSIFTWIISGFILDITPSEKWKRPVN